MKDNKVSMLGMSVVTVILLVLYISALFAF